MTPYSEPPAAEIAALRCEIAAASDPISVLQGRFHGRTALIVSCGPSMPRWREVLDQLPADTVVVGIKQAVNVLRERCHLHFSNPYNRQRYALSDTCLAIYCGVSDAPPVFGRRDLCFKIVKRHDDSLASTLAMTRDFAAHTLEARGESRPWGPGIMYEAVLYSLLHMGFARVTTIGWDIADPAGSNQHFDDSDSKPLHKSLTDKRTKWSGWLWSAINLPLSRTSIAFIRHHLGQRYNMVGMADGEAALVSRSIRDCLAWFSSVGMEINVVSNSAWMRDAEAQQDVIL